MVREHAVDAGQPGVGAGWASQFQALLVVSGSGIDQAAVRSIVPALYGFEEWERVGRRLFTALRHMMVWLAYGYILRIFVGWCRGG